MKTLKLIIVGLMLFLSGAIKSQVSVNVNVGVPPPWGPVGYTDLRYYYLPDVEAYYDINASLFIFNEGGIWVHRANLPGPYRDYDLYGGYKVVMTDYRGEAPYGNFKEYRTKYAKGYHGGPQKTIHERPGRGNEEKRETPKGHSNERQSPGNEKNAGHSNDRGEKHTNDKGNKHSNDRGEKHGGESHQGKNKVMAEEKVNRSK